MVYTYITGSSNVVNMAPRYEKLKFGSFHIPPTDDDDYEDDDDKIDGSNEIINRQLHYLNQEYMGLDFAIEIAQIFHKSAEYHVNHVLDVASLLSHGPLTAHLSSRPLDYLLHISVDVSMRPYEKTRTGMLSTCGRQRVKEETAKHSEYDEHLSWLSHIAQAKQVSQITVRLDFETFTVSAAHK
jgi:hypothetical protein